MQGRQGIATLSRFCYVNLHRCNTLSVDTYPGQVRQSFESGSEVKVYGNGLGLRGCVLSEQSSGKVKLCRVSWVVGATWLAWVNSLKFQKKKIRPWFLARPFQKARNYFRRKIQTGKELLILWLQLCASVFTDLILLSLHCGPMS